MKIHLKFFYFLKAMLQQPFRITHKMVFCTYNSNQSIFFCCFFCIFNHKLEQIISMPLDLYTALKPKKNN